MTDQITKYFIYTSSTQRLEGPYEVERETKTQRIINGRRFRKKDHYEVGQTYPWNLPPRLLPEKSHKAKRLLEAQNRRDAIWDMGKLLDELRKDPEDYEISESLEEEIRRYNRNLKEQL